jgi:GTP cyclohydrolase II
MLLDKNSQILLSVERAGNDLRKGFPVVIKSQGGSVLAMSPETVLPVILNNVMAKTGESVDLILTANRLNFIDKNCDESGAAAVRIGKDNVKDIAALCGLEQVSNVAIGGHSAADNVSQMALKLVRIAELIPAVLVAKLPDSFDTEGILAISAEEISRYAEISSLELVEACCTKLVLKNHINAEIVAYRPNIGGKEHYAIVVGKVDKNPLVRVHSSCYTGDLLESLSCDCHDQLHSAIDLMHKTGGGIILYMLQEGRGIGLINKLRAYAQKELGLDTVDANEALGFDDDERLFQPAATILKKMGIGQVRLLTNNPKKAAGLEDCGIKVSECVPHIMQSNEHNEQYLKTKQDRLGHLGS